MFGKLVHGNEVLKKIENTGDEDGRPSVTVKIVNCGELHWGEISDRKNINFVSFQNCPDLFKHNKSILFT